MLPIAWYGPVWFPVLVCMPLILIASIWLMRAPNRAPEDGCTDKVVAGPCPDRVEQEE